MVCLQLKWSVLTISILGIMATSFVNNYGLIINDVKDIFNFTQIEANMPGALGLTGDRLVIFSAFLLERFGYAWTHLCIIIMSVVPCFLFTYATYFPWFYHNYPWLIYAYHFSIGVGCCTMYISYFKANLANFSSDDHGKILGFISACTSIGPALFTAIYRLPFYGRNKLGEYFIVVGILYFISNLPSILLIREDGTSKEEMKNISETSEILDATKNGEERSLIEVQKETSVDESHDLDMRQIICSPTFHIIVLVMSLGRGAQLTMMNIFGTIANSLQLDHLIGLVGILGPVLSTLCSLLFGFLSDRYVHIIPRVFYIIVVTAVLTTLSLISIWVSKPIFMPNIIFSFVGAAIYIMGVPILLKENFGLRYLTMLFGWVEIVEIFMDITLSWLCGWLYDINVSKQNDNTSNTCIGEECLQTIFVSMTLIYALCCILLVILYFKQNRATIR